MSVRSKYLSRPARNPRRGPRRRLLPKVGRRSGRLDEDDDRVDDEEARRHRVEQRRVHEAPHRLEVVLRREVRERALDPGRRPDLLERVPAITADDPRRGEDPGQAHGVAAMPRAPGRRNAYWRMLHTS